MTYGSETDTKFRRIEMTRRLVIGCGGTLGFGWTAVALTALERQLGWDARSAEVLVLRRRRAVLDASRRATPARISTALQHAEHRARRARRARSTPMTRYPAIDLDGGVVAVTGAAQGIGRATAELFASRGAKVAIGDLDLTRAQEAAAAIGGSAHHLDVSDPESFRRFLDEAQAAHGDLDVLVNNAGVMPNGGFLELDPATERLTMEVNVFGVLHGMRLALPGMLDRGRGHMVNVASLAGKFPVKGLAVYNASKYAVVGLIASTRLEYAPHGVSITAVLPSAVETALSSGLDMKPIPKVQPEDIARAVVGSVASRKGEISVPGYVGALAAASGVTPEPVLNTVRRLFRDDRALRPDGAERAAYRARLNDATTDR
jgi:NAD(P)-dependent dehydrogenase (short-subunit alcohol dehydrogenase family)